MSHKGTSAKSSRRTQGAGNSVDIYGVFKWDEVPVQFTSHAKMHLNEFKLDAIEIIDMLRHQVECPEMRRHRRTETEVCSNKNGQIFRIILFEDYCFDVGQDCWCVKNVKPA